MINSQGRASQLHVPLDEPHDLAGGEGGGGRGLRGGACELKACELTKDPDHCDKYHADDEAWWDDVYYWSTPLEDCGDDDDGDDVQDRRRSGRPAWTEIGGRLTLPDADSVPTPSRRPGRARGGGSPPSSTVTHGSGCGCSSRCRSDGSCVVYFGSLVVLLLVGVLGHRPATREVIHELTLENFQTHRRDARLPRRRLAHDPDGAARHARGRGARVSDRLLHGPSGVARDARASSSSRCSCRSGRATS